MLSETEAKSLLRLVSNACMHGQINDSHARMFIAIITRETEPSECISANEVRALPAGFYRVHWVDGGSELASIGVAAGGERWCAPHNTFTYTSEFDWSTAKRVDRLFKEGI